MKNRCRAIIFVAIFITVLLYFGTCDVYAGNATRMLGFSSRDAAMAGATTASSEDTSCLVRNPAGLVRIGNRMDVEFENIIPHDVTMRTEGVPVGAVPISLSNNGGGLFNAGATGIKQNSTVTYIPGGNVGVSYRVPGTDRCPLSLGCGIFTMAGVATSYPSSRLNPNLETILALGSGVYDRMVDLRSMRIAPGMAIALSDKLSLGATGNIGIQAINCDLAFAEGGRFREQEDAGKWDFAPGGGFTVGLLYKCNDMLSLGTSYESQTWMGKHYKYKNTLPQIDEPPIINAGVSFKPVKWLETTFDMRYINWTSVPIAEKKPIHCGFGWQDQWVFATAAELSLFKERLKLRAGYNYGKSPIQRRFIFANALLPLVIENHFTTGFSLVLVKDLTLDFVWEHHFFNAIADNGEGDIYSQNGVGTKITAAGEVIGVGMGYKFN